MSKQIGICYCGHALDVHRHNRNNGKHKCQSCQCQNYEQDHTEEQ